MMDRDDRRFPGFMVGVSFVVLATVVWLDPWARCESPAKAPKMDSAFTSGKTVRTISKALLLEGDPCSECHADMDPPEQEPIHELEEHEVALHHGPNDRCFNCHHPDQAKRDFFVDDHGGTIAYADVVLLCAKCHGPHYRDWKSGAHGRRTGYWNPEAGEQHFTPCIACHDPHWPVFKKLEAAPKPHALHYAGDAASPPEREENG